MVDNLEEGTNFSEQDETTEGINSENLEDEDLTTDESDADSDVEEREEQTVEKQKPINKTAKKFQKILSEKNQLRDEVEAIKMELSLERLSKTYGDINQEEVKAIKDANKSLSWEDSVILWNAKKPKAETKTKESFIWRESSWWKRNYITDAELWKLSDSEYAAAIDKIKEWKLIHKT